MKDVSDQYTVLATHSSLLEEDKRSDILVGGPDPRLRCAAQVFIKYFVVLHSL